MQSGIKNIMLCINTVKTVYVINKKMISHAISYILRHYFTWLPDKLYLHLLFRVEIGYRLNLKNPQTFSEKIQWLKLYDFRPKYTKMVDKVAVKKIVADIIGDEYIIPTLGVWNSFDEIDFDSLPDRFVLKTSHGGGGGGVVVCPNKNKLDKIVAQKIINSSLRKDISRSYREKPYRDVPRRILAEKYLTNGYDKDLPDYKFYCFNGEPCYCQVIRDRHSKETIDFYDMEWKHQEFIGLNPIAHNGQTPVACPQNFKTMQNICRQLAKDIPFIRVDLYEVNKNVYFGETTFYPASGMGIFIPNDWNSILGDLIVLERPS